MIAKTQFMAVCVNIFQRKTRLDAFSPSCDTLSPKLHEQPCNTRAKLNETTLWKEIARMRRPHILIIGLAIFAIGTGTLTGCGGGKADGEKKPATGAEKGGGGEKDAANLSGPAAATHAFLDAARRGDDERAMGLLTPTAQKEIVRCKLNVAPAASDTAKFDVGEVRNVSESIAHVASRWTKVGADGKPESNEMTWILRRVDDEWRVGGMATVVFEGEPPLLLNFEDPEEMVRKKQLLEKEIVRRIRQAAQKGPSAGEPIRR